MIDAHLKKLRARDDITAEEEEEIRSLPSEVVEVGEDSIVIRHGQELHHSILLLSGWLVRAKDLTGGERQIAELHVPGDFADLHGFTLKRLDHDLVALTRARIALVPHERLKDLTERYPHLARLYWLMTNIDASIQREWTLSLGQRPAIARMAHLFCELNLRLGIPGLAHNNSYDLPMTQVELGQCLGLTSVHINRTLQELRRRGVLDLEGGRLRIHDLEALMSIAEFDAAYLYLDKRPR